MSNSDEKQYQTLLDNVFGKDLLQVLFKGESNNVIGALASKDNYDVFKSNFELLLKDLNNKYKIDSIKQALVEIADSKNWEGAYAELVALSVLKNDYSGDISTDITLKQDMSFAKECGKKCTNEDGYWTDFDAYFDVKIMSDSIKEILDGIIKKVQNKVNSSEVYSVLAEYPMDDNETEYQRNIHQIEKELEDALRLRKTVAHISTLKKLTFHIHWGGGINSVAMTYSPFRHAENTKDIVLKRYANKLLKNKPFFLVFVNFPWFKQLVIDFADMNEYYYRALARRTFMQYEHSREKAKEIREGYIGNQSMRVLARCLTGIIFIEDHSVKETENKYRTFVFLNPNARNRYKSMRVYLEQLANRMIDDFECDNY